jgi:hypothetical protein
LALSFAAHPSFAGSVSTRFGLLKTNDENMLLYKNRPLNPEIQGNNSLSVIGTYHFVDRDVVLFQDNGGSACPAQFYFVTVSASGAKGTSAFGTCTDVVGVKETANAVLVTMHGYTGPFESKASQTKALKEQYIYMLKAGVLTENGKVIK